MQIECQDCGARFRADIPSAARSGIEVRCPRCHFPWTQSLDSDDARRPGDARGRQTEAPSGPWEPDHGATGTSEPDDPLRRAEVLKILREEAEFAEAAKRPQSGTTSKASEMASDASAVQARPVVSRASDPKCGRRRGTPRSNSEAESLRDDESSGWGRAAAVVLVALLVVAAFAYTYPSEIVERIPAAAPYLESFVRAVDDALSRIAELI